MKAGIPAISEDGKSVMNAQLYREAMELAAKYNIAVLAHCEDINLVNTAVSRTKGDVNAREQTWRHHEFRGGHHHCQGHHVKPGYRGETALVPLLHEGFCQHGQACQDGGNPCDGRVLPASFTLTSDDIRKIRPTVNAEKKVAIGADADTNYKMNPPLRAKEDVQALKEGLRDDVMDVIATDHAPHTFEDKNTSMKSAPFGIVGLETAACLTYTELVLGGYLTPMSEWRKMITISGNYPESTREILSLERSQTSLFLTRTRRT